MLEVVAWRWQKEIVICKKIWDQILDSTPSNPWLCPEILSMKVVNWTHNTCVLQVSELLQVRWFWTLISYTEVQKCEYIVCLDMKIIQFFTVALLFTVKKSFGLLLFKISVCYCYYLLLTRIYTVINLLILHCRVYYFLFILKMPWTLLQRHIQEQSPGWKLFFCSLRCVCVCLSRKVHMHHKYAHCAACR